MFVSSAYPSSPSHNRKKEGVSLVGSVLFRLFKATSYVTLRLNVFISLKLLGKSITPVLVTFSHLWSDSAYCSRQRNVKVVL